MIFDNADVLSPAALEAYFPPGRKGNILITSCNSAMKTLTLAENSLEVTEMEEKDAIELLLKSSCLESSTSDVQVEASKIVKELFCFPLAIDQAGTYIASGATTIGDYLAKYSEHRKTLLSHSEFTGASKYNRTVYETWELSYQEIQQRSKSDDSHKVNAANSAMLLLELLPFFHHEGITEEIFSYAALPEDKKTSSTKLPLASSLLDRRLLPLNKSGTWDNFVFREGLRILLSFSLIKKGPSDGVYALHPLVHTWGRDRLTLNKRQECCLMAYVTLSCSLRWDTDQPYGFHRTLVTHVRANMEYFKSEGSQNIVSYMDDACEKFGRLLWEQGFFKEAETLENKVLDTRNRILGVEHPDTTTAMANLAATYRNLGKYVEAENLEIQVLNTQTRILGVEHLHTIYTMANLAATYQGLEKFTEAEKLETQVLHARSRILGVEHPETITAMGNLAVTYQNLRKFRQAEKLEIQVLDARNRILGVEDPDTIIAMGNLAATYRDMGNFTKAEKLDIQVVDVSNRILGVEHPDTITAMANLAATYYYLGKFTEAEKLQIQVLNARNRILGMEHPYTILVMVNLARTYYSLGKYTEAEKLEIQVLDASNRIFGVEHPDTINAMANLAATYGNIEKFTEAERLQIQVLDARNRTLGMEYPDTIMAMESLAATYQKLGKYIHAEKLQIQVLDARNRVLGVEHLHTINAMENLAATYWNMGKHSEAERLEIQLLHAMSKIPGVEHTDTSLAMENLAETSKSGKLHKGREVGYPSSGSTKQGS
jgi:tetratricopeptide (TPR) repeat protein